MSDHRFLRKLRDAGVGVGPSYPVSGKIGSGCWACLGTVMLGTVLSPADSDFGDAVVPAAAVISHVFLCDGYRSPGGGGGAD